MPVNNKLTLAIKDRVVQNFQLNASELLISFVDGSTMTITIAECNSPPLHEGARIRQISEYQAKLLFECEDYSMLDVTIVDSGNSVIVRDENLGSSISDKAAGYSHLPNITHTAGIVVTNPTRARVAPTAFRFSPSRSEKNRAIPAPRKARVTIINASSGRLSLISFTIIQIVEFARRSSGGKPPGRTSLKSEGGLRRLDQSPCSIPESLERVRSFAT